MKSHSDGYPNVCLTCDILALIKVKGVFEWKTALDTAIFRLSVFGPHDKLSLRYVDHD